MSVFFFLFLKDKRLKFSFFFFQAEDGIRAGHVTGVQTCALPISAVGLEAAQRVGCHVDQVAVRPARCSRNQRRGDRVAGPKLERDELIGETPQATTTDVDVEDLERVRRVVHRTLPKDRQPAPDIRARRKPREHELRSDLGPPRQPSLQRVRDTHCASPRTSAYTSCISAAIRRVEKRSVATRRASSPKRRSSSSSPSSAARTVASASASPGWTSRPVRPSSTISGTPPTRVPTTGTPAAIASRIEIGQPS